MTSVTERVASRHVAWHVGTVVSSTRETESAKRLVIDVPTWPGNDAGAHVDIRLTAPDGYQASRAYSVASSGPGTQIVLAVDRLEYGEVSPFLTDELRPGDQLEVHGPLGAYFVWRPPPASDPAPPAPVQLVAAGSGVVPLYAMARAHADAGDTTPFRLLYSVRDESHIFFREELMRASLEAAATFRFDPHYTRVAPDGWSGPAPARLNRDSLAASSFTAEEAPRIYICGPTPFVEMVASWFVELGHMPGAIRAERFGGA
jgi:ferredoxin-NADP reductase